MRTPQIILHFARHEDSLLLDARSEKGEPAAVHVELPFSTPIQRRALSLALGAVERNLAKWQQEPQAFQALKELGLADERGPLGDLAERVGEMLFKTLFKAAASSDVLEAFHSALDRGQGAQPTRVELRIPHDFADLDALPWELLYENATRPFLFRKRSASLVRYIECTLPRPTVKKLEKLFVLLVEARPTGVPMLQEVEGREIEDVLTRLDAEAHVAFKRLPRAEGESTWDCLKGYLNDKRNQKPHVVHFDCHGAFGRKCLSLSCRKINPAGAKQCGFCGETLKDRDEGYLAFEEKDKSPSWVSADQLRDLLSARELSLCVLSACYSGKVQGDSVFWGVGPSLISAGIPAVVAMQFGVTVECAKAFTRDFYSGLAQGDPIVSAVAGVRAAMANDTTGWYRPVLYLRTDDDNPEGNLFHFDYPPLPPPPDIFKPSLSSAQALAESEVRTFSELHWDRDTIIEPFLGTIKHHTRPFRVIAIHGTPAAGFASLHERLARMCQKIALLSPLVHARIDLKPTDVPSIVATTCVENLLGTAMSSNVPGAEVLLDQLKTELTEYIRKAKPDPQQLANKFTKHLAQIEHDFCTVLLLRAPQPMVEDTIQFLKWLSNCSRNLKNSLILLTSEADRLEFLTQQTSGDQSHIFYRPDLPTMTDQDCLDWAHALGLDSMTLEVATAINECAHQNPDKVREYLNVELAKQKGVRKQGGAP